MFYRLAGSPGVRLSDCRIRVELRRSVSRDRTVSRFLEGHNENHGNDDGRVRVRGSVQGRRQRR